MSEIAVCAMFLAAVASPFLALLVAGGWHWFTDRAWRQW